jgi:hypothetical protein
MAALGCKCRAATAPPMHDSDAEYPMRSKSALIAFAAVVGHPGSAALMLVLILGGAAAGCRNETRSSAADVVKETVDEVRKKARLNVQIRLAGNDFPTHDELALRRKLESDVEQAHIGTVLDAGSGSGYMDLTVEVDETVTTIPKIRAILNRAGLLDRSTIRVTP